MRYQISIIYYDSLKLDIYDIHFGDIILDTNEKEKGGSEFL